MRVIPPAFPRLGSLANALCGTELVCLTAGGSTGATRILDFSCIQLKAWEDQSVSHIQLPPSDAGVIPWESIIPPVMLMPLPQECIGFCIFLFISVLGDPNRGWRCERPQRACAKPGSILSQFPSPRHTQEILNLGLILLCLPWTGRDLAGN